MADYGFYVDIYRGDSIPAADFDRMSGRAAAVLARYKRIYTVESPKLDSEDMAICAMADALYYFETMQSGSSGSVTSASIGSVSVSYGNTTSAADLSAKGQAQELYRCACLYLDIYRGA